MPLKFDNLSRAALAIAFCGLLPAILLFHIMPVGSSTEAREAHVASVIFSTGEWILPLRNGIIPSKPPLYHWFAAGLAWGAGQINLLICRLPSVLAGMGVVLLTFFMASYFSAGGEKSRRLQTGLLAVCILGSIWGFVPLLGEARVDMVFAFLAVAGVYAALLDRWSLFFCLSALAVVARGPLGVVLPSLIAFSMLLVRDGLKNTTLRFLTPRLGWLFFVLIAVPWYLLAVWQGGQAFVGRQIVFENLLRFTGGDFVNTQPWWYYIPSFLRSSFPWSLLFLYFAFRTLSRRSPAYQVYAPSLTGSEGIQKAMLTGFLAGLVFFSLASGKRHSYLLPLWPFMSVYLSLALVSSYHSTTDMRRAMIVRSAGALLSVLGIASIVICLSFVLLPFLPPPDSRFAAELILWTLPHRWYFVMVAGLAAVISCYTLLSPPPERSSRLLPALAFCSYSLLCLVFSLGLGGKNYLKGFERIAREINERSVGRELAAAKGSRDESFDVILYYLGKPVSILPPEKALENCGDLLLVAKSWYDSLDTSVSRRLRLVRTLAKTSNQISGKIGEEMVLLECGGRAGG